ncbi:hypothetical protein [Brevibacillus brevis]|uniref:DUF4878 domain-containing protein n=1 Tax=Brevibacillus brevis TaxID=1393 RepID=A0ABY9SWR6_BREBE|nr:hypothetical protein [Brevibacillus brevis]WNC12275.1 hypothetical protein RGB73_16160 [Brevibacillus brevis]
MKKIRNWIIGVALTSIALTVFFQFKDLPGNMGALLTVKELINKHNKESNELINEGAENHTNIQFAEGKYFVDVNKNVTTSEGKKRVNHYEYVLVYEDLKWKVISERLTYTDE